MNIDEKHLEQNKYGLALCKRNIKFKEITIFPIIFKKIIYKYEIPKLKVKKYLHSKMEQKKWLLSLGDGKEIETVYIPEKNREPFVCLRKLDAPCHVLSVIQEL